MKNRTRGEFLWTLILPTLYSMVIFWSSIKAWFGLADDHLHFEAQTNTSGSLYGYLDFYFQLQPWGQTPRFNPSQLIGWSIESTFFGVNPLGWRMTQLIAVVVSGTAIGIATRNFCTHANLSAKKTRLNLVLAQGVFLALPFWSETIGRIGAPETFAAVIFSLMLINISKIFADPNSIVNFVFLAINTSILIGFKENLLTIGISSLILQFFSLHKKKYQHLIYFLLLIVLQSVALCLLILGFLPELVTSGQQVNGAGLGIGRLVFSKWLIVPILSICVMIFSYFFTSPKYRSHILMINISLTTLVFCEYFIMAGRLGGHYGFLSAVLIGIQTIATLAALEKLRGLSITLVSVLAISGLVFNLVSTNNYFQRTAIFKQELLQLQDIQQTKNLRTVLIVASSEEHYEAVSSIISFNRKPGVKYFVLVTEDFPEGALRNNLMKFSIHGNLDWHISPIDEWANNRKCVAIKFSRQQGFKQCNAEIRISWIRD